MGDQRFVVVGGGIVGASVAYHLGERTDDVVVFERGELASETTAKSTAMVGVSGPAPHRRLQEYGFRLYNEFLADPVAEPRYRQCGRLRVATSARGARRLAELADGARTPGDDGSDSDGRDEDRSADPGATRYAGSPAEFVPGERLRDRFLVPPLADVEGALYRPRYGHVHNGDGSIGACDLAAEFVERARDRGVRFETGTAVTDVRTDGGSVTGVEANGTVTDAEAVVCAAGPWSAALAGAVGVDLPVGHVRSPVWALDLDEPLPASMPVVKCHESSVGVHATDDGRVLVTYTPAGDGRGATLDPDAVGDGAAAFRETALRRAERLLPALGDAELRDGWVGVGTTTPDGGPIAGRSGVEGFSLAVSPAGIQYAPAVGALVARQLVGGERTDCHDAAALARFDGHGDADGSG